LSYIVSLLGASRMSPHVVDLPSPKCRRLDLSVLEMDAASAHPHISIAAHLSHLRELPVDSKLFLASVQALQATPRMS
jgi:hypothetical protein